jgi:hypothetical protein
VLKIVVAWKETCDKVLGFFWGGSAGIIHTQAAFVLVNVLGQLLFE